MFNRPHKPKEQEQLELTCSTCGKPIAGKARTDVTRYLFEESRCQCGKPRLVESGTSDESPVAKALPCLALTNTEQQDSEVQAAINPRTIPPWQLCVLANLPENFEAISLLGEGGMGTVWKVRDKNLNKTFAMKILRPGTVNRKETLLRFKQEAQAACQLTHANVATVYNFAVGRRGDPYILMDCLDGETLGKIIEKEECVDVPRAIEFFIQIAEALAHAHSKGVIHRDLKPTNVIVERNPQGIEIAKLVDFGLAKVNHPDGVYSQGLTQTGEVFGSPSYMSPEQCLGRKLDARSDIFAFGCIMYETLTGKKPFPGVDAIETMMRRLNREAELLGKASTAQKISKDLEYVVMRCLEKDASNRYQSVQDLLTDLQLLKEDKAIVNKSKPKRNQTKNNTTGLLGAKLPLLYWISVFFIGPSLIAGVFFAPLFLEYKQKATTNIVWQVPTYPHIQKLPSPAQAEGGLARRLDALAEKYISTRQYEKAIPLLILSADYYRDNENNPPATWIAEYKLQQCYKKLGLPYTRDLNFSTTESSNELVNDWVDLLVRLNRDKETSHLIQKWYEPDGTGKNAKPLSKPDSFSSFPLGSKSKP